MVIIKFIFDLIRRLQTFMIYICVGVSVMIIRNKTMYIGWFRSVFEGLKWFCIVNNRCQLWLTDMGTDESIGQLRRRGRDGSRQNGLADGHGTAREVKAWLKSNSWMLVVNTQKKNAFRNTIVPCSPLLYFPVRSIVYFYRIIYIKRGLLLCILWDK